MKNNQKGFTQILVVSIVLAVLAVVAVLMAQKNKVNQSLTKNTPVINNSNDLTATSNELDKIDMTQFDKEMDGLNSDTSSF